MKKLLLKLLLVSLALFFNGVFGQVTKLSVKEGDVVTIRSGVTEIQSIFLLMWMYGSQNSIIAKIDGKIQKVSLYDVEDGRFEDRLQLDNQTGSLTISDIRNKHSGDYHLKIISDETLLQTFSITVHDVIFAGLENKREGDSVTLHTGVIDAHKLDLIQWTFGPSNAILAEMDMNIQKITYSFDDQYRERLYLDQQTGSLTIKDVKNADAGVYQLQISNSKETSYKTYNVFVAIPEPGLSAGYIVLICFCVVLFVAAALCGIFFYFRYSKSKEKKTVSVTEGNSVTLKTGAKEIQRGDEVLWTFGTQEMEIARIHKTGSISYADNAQFGDKLCLDQQTGDLTISDIRISISGDYQLKIINGKATKMKRFIVIVRVDTLKFTEGESVRLQTGLTKLLNDDLILWKYEPKNTLIAMIDRLNNQTNFYDIDDETFNDRLALNDQTGDLTITNSKSSDSGVYGLQIKSSNKVSYKKFNVLVWLNTLKHTVGDSVTLHTGVAELKNDDRILWKFSDKDTFIAELNRATNQSKLYEGPDGRFRDRLQINQQTGDLTIRNISRAHSDIYTLQITKGRFSSCKRFMVIAHEKTISGTEGDSITLLSENKMQDDHLILWMFGPEDSLIAKGEMHTQNFCTHDGAGGEFTNKLTLDHTNGSLTIKNCTTQHSGVYKLLIISTRETKYKRFRVTINEIRKENTDRGTEEEGIPLRQIN